MGAKPMVKGRGAILILLLVIIGLASSNEANGEKGVIMCKTDTIKLSLCRPAVSGRHPPPPTEACCAVVRHANLPCLCNYKSLLPAIGIDPKKAISLLDKCGLTIPLQCLDNFETFHIPTFFLL